MSSDNGFILRKNSAGKFVLHGYCASVDEFPDVEQSNERNTFDTLEEAMIAYQEFENDWPSEYGLTVRLK